MIKLASNIKAIIIMMTSSESELRIECRLSMILRDYKEIKKTYAFHSQTRALKNIVRYIARTIFEMPST